MFSYVIIELKGVLVTREPVLSQVEDGVRYPVRTEYGRPKEAITHSTRDGRWFFASGAFSDKAHLYQDAFKAWHRGRGQATG